ncbi:hypothetical protein [Reyranella sp.]|uniref:hypothetical protein n=1 Tax=Reyranella sp. TaxID=1929291 RepID=UPI003783858B
MEAGNRWRRLGARGIDEFRRFLVMFVCPVSLLPFFALREISQLLGEGRLWTLMFHRDGRAAIGRYGPADHGR